MTRRRHAVLAIALVALVPITTGADAATTRPDKGLLVSRCAFSHRAPDDPIVHEGMPGMSHMHDFFGNTTTGANSTAASLLAGTTSCKAGGDRAAYWAPTLSSNGTAVTPTGMLAYYVDATTAMPKPLPTGLEIVAGGRAAVRFACFAHGMPRAQHMSPPTCGSDELLSIGVRFPNCWNGVDLASVDQKSHMAYSQGGACPRSHPIAVPRLVMWILYPRQPRGARLTLSSGGLDTAHADFFDAWTPHDYTVLHRYCLVQQRVCYKTMYQILTKLHLARN